MRIPFKFLLVATLIPCAGCTQADDARRDHILAGPHGWIDVTLKAPAAASASAGSAECTMRLQVNGETMLEESADLFRADAANNPIGYRLAVPVGRLGTELTISRCLKDALRLPLLVDLRDKQLALLAFDGHGFVLASTQAWEPATLDTVRGDVQRLHTQGDVTDSALSTLTKLAIASLLVNVVVILAVVIRRRAS